MGDRSSVEVDAVVKNTVKSQKWKNVASDKNSWGKKKKDVAREGGGETILFLHGNLYRRKVGNLILPHRGETVTFKFSQVTYAICLYVHTILNICDILVVDNKIFWREPEEMTYQTVN